MEDSSWGIYRIKKFRLNRNFLFFHLPANLSNYKCCNYLDGLEVWLERTIITLTVAAVAAAEQGRTTEKGTSESAEKEAGAALAVHFAGFLAALALGLLRVVYHRTTNGTPSGPTFISRWLIVAFGWRSRKSWTSLPRSRRTRSKALGLTPASGRITSKCLMVVCLLQSFCRPRDKGIYRTK